VENQQLPSNEVAESFRIPDPMWEKIKLLVPPACAKPKGGRPRNDDRKMMEAIFYVLRTGIQWKALPRQIAAGSSAHERFQEWLRAGVFHRMWQVGLLTYDQVKRIEWEWQAMDGVMTKAPLGGAATGPNPTDRAKTGTKRSLLTDGRGVPLALQVVGANRPDMKLTEATVANYAIARPRPTVRKPQHLCLDAGFDYEEVRQVLEAYGYTAHIRSRADETESKRKIPGYRARRWVVERTHSWMNRFRRLLIRWEKKIENYVAMLEFACAHIAFHVAEVFG
jgi:putative transposase